jgi:hypothetical protein
VGSSDGTRASAGRRRHRPKVLHAQVEARRTAHAIRDYCRALEESHGEDLAVVALIEWIREHAQRVDDSGPPAIPGPLEASSEQLKPFLGGFSPYGPSRW